MPSLNEFLNEPKYIITYGNNHYHVGTTTDGSYFYPTAIGAVRALNRAINKYGDNVGHVLEIDLLGNPYKVIHKAIKGVKNSPNPNYGDIT